MTLKRKESSKDSENDYEGGIEEGTCPTDRPLFTQEVLNENNEPKEFKENKMENL